MTEKRTLFFLQWVVISAFSVLIVLLIIQNLALKRSHPQDSTDKQYMQSRQFEGKLEENFLFKKIPININMDEFYFKNDDQSKDDVLNGYIVILFDITVCGNCLYEELRVLNYFKPMMGDKNLKFLAVAGLVDSGEEAAIISLNRSGLLTFPCKVVNVKELYDRFKLDKEDFLDTPFFLYISHEYRVLDVFKPQYMDTKELSKWLEIIAGQDMF